MTEIPEHLLKRSKERRQAMGLDGGGTEAAAPAAAGEQEPAGASAVEKPAAAPAAARSAAPAQVVAPPPPPPDPPYVAAAKNRKKVPMWAAPVLAILPLWGFVYFQSLQKPEAGANDPLALGAKVYSGKGGCSGCHGSDGSGGVGAKLKDGEVLKTFKNPLSMVHWIAFGAASGARDNGTYGDLDRPGGPHNVNTLPSQMPAQKGKLTNDEIAAVTIYVRQKISGGKDEKGFAVADFPTLGDVVQKVLDLGPGGDPKVPGSSSSKAKAASTKKNGTGTAGSKAGSAGGSNPSGSGSPGGTGPTVPGQTVPTTGGSSGSGSGGSQGNGSGGSGTDGSGSGSGGSSGSGGAGSAGGGG